MLSMFAKASSDEGQRFHTNTAYACLFLTPSRKMIARTRSSHIHKVSAHDNNACRWSCSTSCEAGVSQSAPLPKGNSRSEAATARAVRAGQERTPLEAPRLLNPPTNDRVSSEKRPPHFHCEHHQACAGGVCRPVQDMWPLCAFVLLSLWPHLPQRLGWHPSAAHTPKVVSTANWAPLKKRPSTTISSRLPSASAPTEPRSRSPQQHVGCHSTSTFAGRSVLQHSPEPTLASPEPPHARTLLGGGPKRREGGHTGKYAP